jgi:hypothetical protein
MLLGFASFAERPFSTVADDNSVNIQVTGNALAISIGTFGIVANSDVENVDGNTVTLGTGSLTFSGAANLSVTGNPTSLGIGSFVVTADANVTAVKNTLTLSTGSVTVTGTALVNPTGSQLTANTGEAGVITWNDIIPGVNMTWTPIEPY